MESGRIQVTLALIAMFSGWGAALITNWGDWFGEVQAEPPKVAMIEREKYDLLVVMHDESLRKLQGSELLVSNQSKEILKLNSEIIKLKDPFDLISNTKLKQLLKFHNSAVCYGRSLNFTHPASEDYEHCLPKDMLAKKLLLFFEELEIVKGNSSNYSKERAKEELIQLQKKYNFNKPGWYTEFMLGILIIEYAKRS